MIAAKSKVGGVALLGLAACPFTYDEKSRYTGVASLLFEQPGAGRAVPVSIELVDCGDDGVRIELDGVCELRGTWSDDDGSLHGAHPGWRSGTIVMTAGAMCMLPLQDGTTTLRVTSGVARVAGSRTLELSLDAVLGSGSSSGARGSFRFEAAPTGSAVLATCGTAKWRR